MNNKFEAYMASFFCARNTNTLMKEIVNEWLSFAAEWTAGYWNVWRERFEAKGMWIEAAELTAGYRKIWRVGFAIVIYNLFYFYSAYFTGAIMRRVIFMLKTFCKEFVKTTIYSAVSTVVTIGTIAMIGIVKEKIENSKENK